MGPAISETLSVSGRSFGSRMTSWPCSTAPPRTQPNSSLFSRTTPKRTGRGPQAWCNVTGVFVNTQEIVIRSLLRFRLRTLIEFGHCPSSIPALTRPRHAVISKSKGHRKHRFLALPFCPQWQRARLQAEINKVNSLWGRLLGFTLRISWGQGGPQSVTKLKSLSSKIHTDALNWRAVWS